MKRKILIVSLSVMLSLSFAWADPSCVISVKVAIESAAPVVKITSPADEDCYSSSPITVSGTVTGALSEIKSFEVTSGSNSYNAVIQPDGSFSVSGVEITGGPNNITATAQDVAGNDGSSSVTVFLGWLLHMKVPYYTKTQDYYSGAASCQVVLNYIRDGLADPLAQDEIYSYGHPYNYSENASIQEMDPSAIQYALGHFDPYDISDPTGHGDMYRAYNFDVDVFESTEFNKYLRDIVHWMAYPVTIDKWWLDGALTAHPNVPVAVPSGGKYGHWIIVNGASASQNPVPDPHTNPWYTPDFTVYGLWLTDPAADGIGKDIYVTAQAAQSTYLLPLVSTDRYNGKYLHVAEPPEVASEADVSVAQPNINGQTLKLINMINGANTGDASAAINLKKGQVPAGFDWTKIIDQAVLTDADCKNAFDGSQAMAFIKIRRADKDNSFYYLIPFAKCIDGQFLTYAAITIDSVTGSFEEASWVQTPTRFIQIGKKQAGALALSKYPDLSGQKLSLELIWQPGDISSSPFYPYWKISSGNRVYFVTQKGEILSF